MWSCTSSIPASVQPTSSSGRFLRGRAGRTRRRTMISLTAAVAKTATAMGRIALELLRASTTEWRRGPMSSAFASSTAPDLVYGVAS